MTAFIQLAFPFERAQDIIRSYLWQGGWYCATHLNKVGGTGDARKCISRLRRKGYPIEDRYCSRDGVMFKEYHLNPRVKIEFDKATNHYRLITATSIQTFTELSSAEAYASRLNLKIIS